MNDVPVLQFGRSIADEIKGIFHYDYYPFYQRDVASIKYTIPWSLLMEQL